MRSQMRFATMSDDDLVDWWRQYGLQAEWYRDVPRRSCWAEIRRRGLKVKPTQSVRPRGYDTATGYMFWWGLGGHQVIR